MAGTSSIESVMVTGGYDLRDQCDIVYGIILYDVEHFGEKNE